MSDAGVPIIVTRHRESVPLGSGRSRHVFEAVGYDGLFVTCLTDATTLDCQSEPHVISQLYELDDGRKFAKIDDALAAWQATFAPDETVDLLAQALRRFTRGLSVTRWEQICDADKSSWRRSAGVFVRLLRAFGLRLVRDGEGASAR